MTSVPRNQLLIKVTAGNDAPERCSQAFTVAATAAASGVQVSLWLTGDAAWFALPGKAAEFELEHSASLSVGQVFQHRQHAAGVALADGFHVTAFLQQLAAHVQGQVG